jgi:hypothetical protein
MLMFGMLRENRLDELQLNDSLQKTVSHDDNSSSFIGFPGSSPRGIEMSTSDEQKWYRLKQCQDALTRHDESVNKSDLGRIESVKVYTSEFERISQAVEHPATKEMFFRLWNRQLDMIEALLSEKAGLVSAVNKVRGELNDRRKAEGQLQEEMELMSLEMDDVKRQCLIYEQDSKVYQTKLHKLSLLNSDLEAAAARIPILVEQMEQQRQEFLRRERDDLEARMLIPGAFERLLLETGEMRDEMKKRINLIDPSKGPEELRYYDPRNTATQLAVYHNLGGIGRDVEKYLEEHEKAQETKERITDLLTTLVDTLDCTVTKRTVATQTEDAIILKAQAEQVDEESITAGPATAPGSKETGTSSPGPGKKRGSTARPKPSHRNRKGSKTLEEGQIAVELPLGGVKPFLRANVRDLCADAKRRNASETLELIHTIFLQKAAVDKKDMAENQLLMSMPETIFELGLQSGGTRVEAEYFLADVAVSVALCMKTVPRIRHFAAFCGIGNSNNNRTLPYSPYVVHTYAVAYLTLAEGLRRALSSKGRSARILFEHDGEPALIPLSVVEEALEASFSQISETDRSMIRRNLEGAGIIAVTGAANSDNGGQNNDCSISNADESAAGDGKEEQIMVPLSHVMQVILEEAVMREEAQQELLRATVAKLNAQSGGVVSRADFQTALQALKVKQALSPYLIHSVYRQALLAGNANSLNPKDVLTRITNIFPPACIL